MKYENHCVLIVLLLQDAAERGLLSLIASRVEVLVVEGGARCVTWAPPGPLPPGPSPHVAELIALLKVRAAIQQAL